MTKEASIGNNVATKEPLSPSHLRNANFFQV